MSILSGFKSFERYIKTDSGYQLASERTLAKDVLLGDDGSGNSVETEIANLNTNLTNLGESVADGKASVASAITSMGVTTASDATFATMANNIKSIKTSGSIDSQYLFYDIGTKLSANALHSYSKTFTAEKDGTVVFQCACWYSYISKKHSMNVVTVYINDIEVPTISIYDVDEYNGTIVLGGFLKTIFKVKTGDSVTIKYKTYMANGYSGYCFAAYNARLYEDLDYKYLSFLGTFTNNAKSIWNITLSDNTGICTITNNIMKMLKSGTLKFNFTAIDTTSAHHGSIYKNGSEYTTLYEATKNGKETVLDVAVGDEISVVTDTGQTISNGKLTFWML